MGLYNDQILPRFIDVALGKSQDETRARVTAGLSGEVLEVGFGSGRNLPHLPGAVTKLKAVEPATVGQRLAADRIASCPAPVEFVGLDGEDLPLEDNSVDHVLVTWTLCTIPDVDRALREIHRVLRPGGGLHFVEHVRSPNPNVARWQDRLTPVWGKLFGGCHLNRATPELIENAGLSMTRLETFKMVGPELVGYAVQGTATKNGATPV